MSKRSVKVLSGVHLLHSQPTKVGSLIFYSLIIFFVRFGDAIMSYLSPVYIDNALNNPLLMGLIISSSSIVGLICDIIFGVWFSNKKFGFFLYWGTIGALLFPLSYLFFPPLATFFIISMIIWGVYYELILFSNFHFINHFLDHSQHAMGWGILYTFIAAAYMLAPLVASALIDLSTNLPLYAAIGSMLIGFLAYFIFSKRFKKSGLHSRHPKTKKSIIHQLQLWIVLSKVLWPVLLFIIVITILDATFWTSGAVLSESLKQDGLPGGILFIVYLLPSLFMGIFASKLSYPFGKKKAAFASGLTSGVLLMFAGQMRDPIHFIFTVFIASIFIAISLPEINGTVEDYIDRLGDSANSMIGLENAATSISYIIGPILAGTIASLSNHQFTFVVIGGMLAITSTISLLYTPRKIRLPQQTIHVLEDTLTQK